MSIIADIVAYHKACDELDRWNTDPEYRQRVIDQKVTEIFGNQKLPDSFLSDLLNKLSTSQ